MCSISRMSVGILLGIGLAAAVFSFGSDAYAKSKKPTLSADGICISDKSCAYTSPTATCAKLYCQALGAQCKGDYSSGTCKQIKEIYDAANCDFVRPACGGGGLPIIRPPSPGKPPLGSFPRELSPAPSGSTPSIKPPLAPIPQGKTP